MKLSAHARRAILGLFTLGIMHSLVAVAYDLDWRAAKAKYDRQVEVRDRAKERYDSYLYTHNDIERRYYDAVSNLREQERNLDNKRRELTNTSDEITRLERELPGLQSEVVSLTGQKEKAQTAVQNAERVLQRLQREIERHREQLNRILTELNDEKAKPEPNQDKIAKLEERKTRQEAELNSATSEAAGAERELRQRQSEFNRLERDLRDAVQRVAQTQNEISRLDRRRDELLIDVERAQTLVNRAEEEERRAERDLETSKREVARLESEYNREAELARQAYSYYEEVLANYNREKQKVVDLANATGGGHGAKEASDRAPEPAQQAGTALAKKLGFDKGNAEAQVRDEARGQRDARKNAATAADLAAVYQEGRANGVSRADGKARKEDFPRGHNDSMTASLSAPLVNQASVDISQTLPADPGGPDVTVVPRPLNVGSEPSPLFPISNDPAYALPSYPSVTVTIPELDWTYFAPPCSGLILSEFEGICKEAYNSSYYQLFQARYREIYSSEHKKLFGSNIKDAYELGLSQNHATQFQAGRVRGAKEQGILDGFADRLPTARTEQYAAGGAEWARILASGNLVRVVSAELIETSGDELFTPGEPVKVAVIVDNYGGQASPLSALKLTITSTVGIVEMPIPVRELPALAASTRTRLEGVLAPTIARLFAGDKLSLKVEVSHKTGGALGNAEASAVAHFPIELEAITIPGKPKVDQQVAATFRYKNLTRGASDATKVKLTTEPAIVETPKEPIALPAIEAGQTAEIPVTIKPGVWVGENTAVNFVSVIEKAPGIEQLTQPFLQSISIDRAASLLLFNTSGAPVPTQTFVVKAGSQQSLQVKVKYHRPNGLPGPFVLKLQQTSDAALKPASGSTISVNYGSLSPNMQLQPVRFTYDVPQSLKGKKVWALISLSEGSKHIHVMQVYFDVR